MPGLLRRGDAAMTAALLMVFAVMVGEASRYPRDSRLFPVMVGIAGLALAALLLLRMAQGAVAKPSGEDVEEADFVPAAPLWAAVLAAPLFGLVMWVVGFWAATVICTFFGPAVMGYRRLRVRIGLTIGTLAVMVVLFPVMLNLPMPRGEIMDRMFQVPDDED
jgi:hypothetical protein